MWARILPFAVWLWLTDAIENLFSMVDRYLILHIAMLEPSGALAQIGQYHSARLVSVVLLNVAALLGALLTPYVSRDWESGQADHVEVRLGLTLKLTGLALVAVAAGALALAPPFFATFFQGRFDGGLVAMPWVLAGCVWMGMAFVARTHLWCAEKPRLWFIAVTAGLMTNVGLAFALLPRYGLVGAAASTAIAQLVTFAIILGSSRATGVRFGGGTWMVVALPAVILLGPWASGVAVLAVTVLVLTTDWFLQPAERRAALSLVGKRWRRCTTPSGI